jgi:putative peptide zinc metalloprotease protein
MLPKMIMNGASRLRYGVVPLAIFAPLAVPGTAAAGVSPGPQPATYVNSANATSEHSYFHAFDERDQVDQGAPTVLTATNEAVALTANCKDCGALAIAFQVVFVSDQNLTATNATNNADATSYGCTNCTNIAEAYQIIVATDEQTQLTFQQQLGLLLVRAKLEGLRLQWPSLDATQIEDESDALANQAVSIVDNPAYTVWGQTAPSGGLARESTVTPAINAAAQPAELTESTQPIVDLYIDVKVST